MSFEPLRCGGRARATLIGALSLATVVAGCSASRAPSPVSPRGFDAASRDPGLAARSFERRPSVVVLEREGDPAGAVAVNLAMPQLVHATALLAFIEARLLKAHVARFSGQADRFGLRVRVSVADAAAAAVVTREVLTALSTPLDAEPSAVKLATARVAALSARPADDPALLPLLQCTGQALLAGEPLLALDKGPDFVALEAARKRAVGHATVTVGVVGPASFGAAVVDGIVKSDPWQAAGERASSTIAPTEIAYLEPTRRRGSKIIVARASPGPIESFAFAEPSRVAAVSAHLARARAPRLQRVLATAHAGGSCALYEVEGDTDIEGAASIARLLHDELSRPAPRDAGLAARAVRNLEDPLDAAAAAALFGAVDADAPAAPTFVVAVGLPAPRTKTPELDVARREASATLSRALSKVDPASAGVEIRVRAEPGQRHAWVALGTTCATTEPDVAAGVTAALTTSLAASAHEGDDVVVEPFSSSSGAGLVVHGPPRPGEGEADHARRIARAAAKALLGGPPKPDAYLNARAVLSARLDDAGDRAREPVVAALGRGRVSHFLPWGTSEGLGRLDGPSLSSRWSTLASGPLRVAVIAPSNLDHAKLAAEEVEPFTRGTEPRRCSASPTWDRPSPGSRSVVPPPGLSARAYVAAPVDARDAVAVSALAVWLNDPEGTPASLARTRGLSLRAYLLGELEATLVVVELSGPSGALESGANELSMAIAAAAKQPADGRVERALARAIDDDVRERSSPRRRVLDVFRDRSTPAPPRTEAFVELAKKTFASTNLSTVLATPKP